MKLFIPSIGDQIRLTADWEFAVFFESRNYDFLSRLRPGIKYGRHGGELPSIMMTLPRGTVLGVDRIYIRKGGEAFDSLTFFIKTVPGDEKRAKIKHRFVERQYGNGMTGRERIKYYVDGDEEIMLPEMYTPGASVVPTQSSLKIKLAGARFWAKLYDVNTIECEKVTKE